MNTYIPGVLERDAAIYARPLSRGGFSRRGDPGQNPRLIRGLLRRARNDGVYKPTHASPWQAFVLVFLLTMGLIGSPQAKEAVAANQPVAVAQVRIGNFTFAPAEIAIAPGTTVTWINEDDIPHLVAATGNAFRSKALDTDQQYSFTFTKPGTYDYFCALHPHMQGKIIVK